MDNKALGLSKENLNFIKHTLLSILKKKGEYSVYVFGSRATGKYRKYSDIDILIFSNPELSLSELDELKNFFEESDLPIKVDLIISQRLLEDYRNRVESEKVLWFQK